MYKVFCGFSGSLSLLLLSLSSLFLLEGISISSLLFLGVCFGYRILDGVPPPSPDDDVDDDVDGIRGENRILSVVEVSDCCCCRCCYKL